MAGPQPAGDGTPGFDIRFDEPARVLHIRLWGFWSLPTVARRRHPRFAVLSDSMASLVRSPRWPRPPGGSSRGARANVGRTAIVVASRLNKLQAERSMHMANLRICLDANEAAAWLGQDDGNGR